ncbi:MAG: lytic murein transglycosylase [Candidatus Binatia bacterium]
MARAPLPRPARRRPARRRGALRRAARRRRGDPARRDAVRPQHRPAARAGAARQAGHGQRSRQRALEHRPPHRRRAAPPARGGRVAVRARARDLERTFYPEVIATFAVAARNRIDPLDLTGSGAGAFGLPQFLPSSYLRYAVDGDGDGRVSLYDADDAIASAANYLRANGWRPGIGYEEQRRVIWTYNHSDAYIDTVLTLAGTLR